FTRQLPTEMAHFLIRRTIAIYDGQGQLTRPVAAGDTALIAASIANHVSEHLAMSLALEDVVDIARHTDARLRDMGFLSRDAEALAYRPSLFHRPGLAIRRWLGMSPPSFAGDLEKSGRRHRDELWSGHIAKLNAEILDRAGSTFTRLIGEEIL